MSYFTIDAESLKTLRAAVRADSLATATIRRWHGGNPTNPESDNWLVSYSATDPVSGERRYQTAEIPTLEGTMFVWDHRSDVDTLATDYYSKIENPFFVNLVDHLRVDDQIQIETSVFEHFGYTRVIVSRRTDANKRKTVYAGIVAASSETSFCWDNSRV